MTFMANQKWRWQSYQQVGNCVTFSENRKSYKRETPFVWHWILNSKPAPEFVPITKGFNVILPAVIVPTTTKDVDPMFVAKFNRLRYL